MSQKEIFPDQQHVTRIHGQDGWRYMLATGPSMTGESRFRIARMFPVAASHSLMSTSKTDDPFSTRFNQEEEMMTLSSSDHRQFDSFTFERHFVKSERESNEKDELISQCSVVCFRSLNPFEDLQIHAFPSASDAVSRSWPL